MSSHEGSNDEKTMEGNTKQVYAKKVVNAVPGCSPKLRKLLKKIRKK